MHEPGLDANVNHGCKIRLHHETETLSLGLVRELTIGEPANPISVKLQHVTEDYCSPAIVMRMEAGE